MRTIKRLSLLFFVLISFAAFAQKTASVGIKAGFPNVAGANAELILPLLDNRLSVYVDYSKFEIEPEDDASVDFKYKEYGANFYIGPRAGRGLYLSAGRGDFDSKILLTNIELDGGRTGEGILDFDLNLPILKLVLEQEEWFTLESKPDMALERSLKKLFLKRDLATVIRKQ